MSRREIVHNSPGRPQGVRPDVGVATQRELLNHGLDLLIIQEDISLVLPGVFPCAAFRGALRVRGGEEHTALCGIPFY